LLGVIAIRFPGQTLKWDDKAMRITNNDAANAFVNPPYRKGGNCRVGGVSAPLPRCLPESPRIGALSPALPRGAATLGQRTAFHPPVVAAFR